MPQNEKVPFWNEKGDKKETEQLSSHRAVKLCKVTLKTTY